MKSYKTVKIESSDEFIERHSRFIGYCCPCKTEEEATTFINKIKSKHWDAKHNVYAYTLRKNNIQRYSDDGEPQGTAGIPVLEVIKKSELYDVCVVVTRYFGGILLGAGGLVRAYSHGAKIGLESGGIIEMKLCKKLQLSCSYDRYGKLSTLIPQMNGVIDDSTFLDDVSISFHIPIDEEQSFSKALADLTNGQVSYKEIDEDYYEMK